MVRFSRGVLMLALAASTLIFGAIVRSFTGSDRYSVERRDAALKSHLTGMHRCRHLLGLGPKEPTPATCTATPLRLARVLYWHPYCHAQGIYDWSARAELAPDLLLVPVSFALGLAIRRQMRRHRMLLSGMSLAKTHTSSSVTLWSHTRTSLCSRHHAEDSSTYRTYGTPVPVCTGLVTVRYIRKSWPVKYRAFYARLIIYMVVKYFYFLCMFLPKSLRCI